MRRPGACAMTMVRNVASTILPGLEGSSTGDGQRADVVEGPANCPFTGMNVGHPDHSVAAWQHFNDAAQEPHERRSRGILDDDHGALLQLTLSLVPLRFSLKPENIFVVETIPKMLLK